jgi:hypothetical protein
VRPIIPHRFDCIPNIDFALHLFVCFPSFLRRLCAFASPTLLEPLTISSQFSFIFAKRVRKGTKEGTGNPSGNPSGNPLSSLNTSARARLLPHAHMTTYAYDYMRICSYGGRGFSGVGDSQIEIDPISTLKNFLVVETTATRRCQLT